MKSLKASPGRKWAFCGTVGDVWKFLDRPVVAAEDAGSFDCAATSLRFVTAPLRMTEFFLLAIFFNT
jgi:hypothetical protein